MMIPDKIDRYEIIKTLGQGGFGIVYLANEPRLKRKVAIKLLREEPAQLPDTSSSVTPKTARERFEDEAQMLVKLDFDGIVSIFDYGEYEGRPYLVMQYMPGGTLAEKIAGQPLSLTDTAVILNRLCTALDKVHQRNTIHRDLKPLNILFDADGEAYLSDFGIARLAENTKSTVGIGTPRYMAPEQFKDDPITFQTDIYQMGVILFEMLTGQTPFNASTNAAVIQKVLNQPTPSVRELNSSLDPAFDDIIKIVMAKNAADRYKSATSLAEHFSALVHDEAVPADIPVVPVPVLPDPEPLTQRSKPRQTWLFAALLLIPLLIVGFLLLQRSLSLPNRGESIITPPQATEPSNLTIILVTVTGQPVIPSVAENVNEVETSVAFAATATAETLAIEAQNLQATQTSLAQQVLATEASPPKPSATPIVAFSSPDILAARINRAVVIDGNLREWASIVPIRLDHIVYRDDSWDGSEDMVVIAQLAWDDSFLYLGITAVDDIHVQTQSGNQIFKGDSVSLQIDTDYAGDLSEQVSPDDFQIDISPGDFITIAPSAHRFRGTDTGVMGNAPDHTILVQAQQTGDGYTLEAAIPWADLGIHPQGGERFGLAVNATDNDTPNTAVQELFISNIAGRRFNDPSSWGTLTLQGHALVASAPSPTPPTSSPTLTSANGLMVEDFEYSNEDALTNEYWINSPGNQVNLHLSGSPNTFSGQKALAVTYQLNPDPGDYLGIERNLSTAMDWSDYNSICFWLDNSSFTGFLIFQFKEQNSESWKYRAPINPATRGEICLALNDEVFSISSRKLNNIMDLTAVDNYAFYLGEGGIAEGTLYLDALRLKP